MLKCTQPKVPSHFFIFSVFNFIFAAQQPDNKTHPFQRSNNQYYNTITLTKNSRHPILLNSPALYVLKKLIVLPSQPLSLRIPTNLAATHWTIPDYIVVQPCLLQLPARFAIFHHFIFQPLDPVIFTIFSTIWPQFQSYPDFNLPRQTPPPAQRPPTLKSSSPQRTSTDPSPRQFPRLLQIPESDRLCLKTYSFLQTALLLLPPHLHLPRRHPSPSLSPSP